MTTPTAQAITANIAIIENRLTHAAVLASSALKAAESGAQNLAIGTLLPVEQDLADAEALLKTIFVLHRAEPLARGGPQ